jgi:hypothetical protein
VAIEAPQGSVIVWHGGLWHGAFVGKTEGLRRTLVRYYARAYIEAQEMYKLTIPPEMPKRNSVRFGAQMGLTDWVPWGQSGPAGGAVNNPSQISPSSTSHGPLSISYFRAVAHTL